MLSLFAQTAVPVEAPWHEEILHSGALGFLIDGGLFMWPILLMAIVGAAVVIERFRTYWFLTSDTHDLRRQVREAVAADRIDHAIEACLEKRGPVPAVLAVGLQRYELMRGVHADAGETKEQVEKAMDDYGVHVTAALEKNLLTLATIANVAPLVGSVGTVVGMIVLFADVAAMAGTQNIVKVAAAGIKIKLLVTAWGLMVGIPAYLFYNYFTATVNRLNLDVEEAATELMEAITVRLARAKSSAAPTPYHQATA